MTRTLAALALLLAGCASKSSSDTPDAGEGGSDAQTDAPALADAGAGCTTTDQCDPSDCVCRDGTSRQIAGSTCPGGGCVAPGVACAPVCAQSGGATSSTPAPNVVGSQQCDAFCAKALSLKCPEGSSCRPYYNCAVPPGECPASVTAELACQLEAGAWSCDTFGDWVVNSKCTGVFTGMCAGDAGED